MFFIQARTGPEEEFAALRTPVAVNPLPRSTQPLALDPVALFSPKHSGATGTVFAFLSSLKIGDLLCLESLAATSLWQAPCN